MQAGLENDLVVAKLDDGEDLFASVRKLSENFNIKGGIILTNIGMLRDYELNFFTPEGYQAKEYQGPHELVAMHGSVAEDGSIHIHCALAHEDHTVHGGHLTKATVAVLNELVIRRLNDIKITRVHNPDTGLNETSVS